MAMFATATQLITITRPTGDAYTLSYDVWVNYGRPPDAVGDGIFVGTYPIEPDEPYIAVEVELTKSGTPYFLVVPRRHEQIGRETSS